MDSGILTSLDLNTMLLGMQAKCAVPFLAAVSHPLSSHGTPGQVSNFKSSCKGWPSLPLHPSCATETVWCHVQGPQELWSFMSQCRKNSARGKVIDKRWFIRIEPLRGLQAGRWEDVTPQELTGLQFYNQSKSGEREKSFCLSWVDVMFPSSGPPSGWAGEFSCPYVVKLGPQIVAFICAESMS